MLRVFVDSGSSIKQEEKEKYQVELIPLRYMMGENEYQDGIDLSINEFYNLLINKKYFPKTSLPNLVETEERVNKYTEAGDDVFIITISSHISGTFNAMKSLFQDNTKVTVIDSKSAVGGIRLIVEEINKYRNHDIDTILQKVNKIIPKIRILAIPETLNYLLKGGRLSKKEWVLGSLLNIKPIITIMDGIVKVIAKKVGLKNAMKHIADSIKTMKCSKNHSIIPSFTYKSDNLDKLISMTDTDYHKQMIEYDNLDPVIACHWGPNAFGYIFVSEE